MDQTIDDLMNELATRDLLGRSLLIITADHGEEIYDHGGWGHRHQLHDELPHVPLVIRWPGGEQADTRVTTLVSLVDLAPTILNVLGLRVPSDFKGTPRA